MSPIIVTLAQAGGHVAPAVRVVRVAAPVPPTGVTEGRTIPEARQPTHAGSYFLMFKPCSCGHSSAWHSGSFGDAWRAGEQVQGGCEATDESSDVSCQCSTFSGAGPAA